MRIKKPFSFHLFASDNTCTWFRIQKFLSISAHGHLVPASFEATTASLLGVLQTYVHYKYVYICVCEYVCYIFFSFEHKVQQTELTTLHCGKPGSLSLISGPRDKFFLLVPLKLTFISCILYDLIH